MVVDVVVCTILESNSFFLGISRIYMKYTYKLTFFFSCCDHVFYYKGSRSRTQKGRGKIIFPPLHHWWNLSISLCYRREINNNPITFYQNPLSLGFVEDSRLISDVWNTAKTKIFCQCNFLIIVKTVCCLIGHLTLISLILTLAMEMLIWKNYFSG